METHGCGCDRRDCDDDFGHSDCDYGDGGDGGDDDQTLSHHHGDARGEDSCVNVSDLFPAAVAAVDFAVDETRRMKRKISSSFSFSRMKKRID